MVQACSIMETALQRMDANLSSDMLNDVFTFLFSYFPVTYLTPPIVAGATDVVRSVVLGFPSNLGTGAAGGGAGVNGLPAVIPAIIAAHGNRDSGRVAEHAVAGRGNSAGVTATGGVGRFAGVGGKFGDDDASLGGDAGSFIGGRMRNRRYFWRAWRDRKWRECWRECWREVVRSRGRFTGRRFCRARRWRSWRDRRFPRGTGTWREFWRRRRRFPRFSSGSRRRWREC